MALNTLLLTFNIWTDNPSPDKYSLTSPFDPKELEIGTFGKPKKSFCFGAGREDFSKTVYNASNLSPDPEIPGPG